MENAVNKVHFKVSKPRGEERVDGKKVLFAIGNLLLLILSIFLIYNIVKSVDLTMKKIDILHQAQREVDELRLRNVSLILSKDEVETDDFIETEARDRLNLSREDELVFVIPDEAYTFGLSKVREVLEGDTLEEDVVSIKIWVDFLFGVYN